MARAVTRHHYKHNRLQQLRGFCFAVQGRSISKAAERMFLSQPSVSLQIQALERELGVVLFERRGPKIRVTPEGQMLYELALPLLEGVDALPEAFAARRGSFETGALDIAAGESTILYLVPKVLQGFSRRFPKIRVRFHNVPGRIGLELIRGDEVDFAVGSFGEVPDDISYQPTYEFSQTLIAAAGHPLAGKPRVTIEEASPYPFILPPRHLNTLGMVELAFQQRHLNLDVRLEAGGWEVIKRYVQLGLGISIVSGICLTDDDRLASFPMDDYFPKRTYGIVMRRGKFLSPQAKRFIEAMDPSFFGRGAPP